MDVLMLQFTPPDPLVDIPPDQKIDSTETYVDLDIILDDRQISLNLLS